MINDGEIDNNFGLLQHDSSKQSFVSETNENQFAMPMKKTGAPKGVPNLMLDNFVSGQSQGQDQYDAHLQ